MKKLLIWFGGMFLVLVMFMLFVLTYANIDKRQYDEIAEQHIRKVINDLSNLSMEQFDAYWGPNKPGTPDLRMKMVSSISRLGHLVSIDSISKIHYQNRISLKGISHVYVYNIKAKYSNAPAEIKLFLKGEKHQLATQDIKFFSEALLQ